MPVRSGTGRSIAIGAITAGGVVAIGGMFGPWVRTGSASRSSFELADLVVRLGFARSGAVGLALRTWPMAPLSVVVAVVAAWWIGGRIAATLSIAVGVVVGLVGASVWGAPESVLLGSRWGSLVTAAGAATMIAGGGLMWATNGSAGARALPTPAPGSLVPDAAPLEDLP